MRTKAELFLPYQARFARITGLASSTTMYTGVLLASFVGLGSFSYVFTTPWGLLATAYFISVMINQSHVLRLKHDSPISTAFLIFGTVTLLATAVVVVAYASLPTNLTVFEHSNWGLAVLASGLLAIFISRFGLLFGTVRTQLTQLAPKILSGDDGDKEGTSGKQFNLLQRRLQLTMIPETIIIFIVVALMVYSGSPF